MKIAHVVSTFPPYHAGIGNAAYHLSWELAKLGHSITVFTLTPSERAEIDQGMPFMVRRLRPWLKYGNGGFVPQLLWHLRSFDIVHIHYPFFGGAEVVYAADRLRPLKLVVHYHMDTFGVGALKRIMAWHRLHIMPRILNRARSIIVTSRDYAEQSSIAEIVSARPDACVEIPLGVNPDVFKPRPSDKDLIAKRGLENKFVILFVGALDRAHYFKGITYLLKAFQTIASNDAFRLIIAGTGNLRRSYESMVTNYGLERKVQFAGFVPDDVLPLYYNMADVFVLPSIDSSEAFGIAVLEAMSSGVPVIASDLPGVRSVVARNATGILVKPKNVESIAKQLLYLQKNPHIRNEMGRAARERVLQNYTWELVGRKVHRLYESIQ